MTFIIPFLLKICYFEIVRDENKRLLNETKFQNWTELSTGGRKYWIDINGRHGCKARYIKTVDESEETTAFFQEIYDKKGDLIEVYEKFPVDKGHRKVREE